MTASRKLRTVVTAHFILAAWQKGGEAYPPDLSGFVGTATHYFDTAEALATKGDGILDDRRVYRASSKMLFHRIMVAVNRAVELSQAWKAMDEREARETAESARERAIRYDHKRLPVGIILTNGQPAPSELVDWPLTGRPVATFGTRDELFRAAREGTVPQVGNVVEAGPLQLAEVNDWLATQKQE